MKQVIQSHKDLIVWNKAMELVEKIYLATQQFPREEQYGITSQMRRSSVAIPSNIAEGYHRHHLKEYVQFLYIAKSSACELETLLNISTKLKYLNNSEIAELNGLLEQILKMLTALINKLKHFKRIGYNLTSKP